MQMTRVETIEEEIQTLSQAEFEELREWILEKDWQAWDKQIEEELVGQSRPRLSCSR